MRLNNIRSSVVFSFVCVLFCFLLSGCGELGIDAPEKHTYVLDVGRVGEPAGYSNGKILQVRQFRISSRFAGTQLVYRTGEFSYETDFYNIFLSPPAGNVTEEFRQWFADSGLFGSVVNPSSRVVAELLVEGNISALYGDYTDLNAPKAVMEIEIFMVQRNGGDDRVEYHDVYREEVELESRRAEALIAGLNTCLDRTLKSMETVLKESAILK